MTPLTIYLSQTDLKCLAFAKTKKYEIDYFIKSFVIIKINVILFQPVLYIFFMYHKWKRNVRPFKILLINHSNLKRKLNWVQNNKAFTQWSNIRKIICNYINMKLNIHFSTLEEWSIADYCNLFETINGYQLKLLSSMSFKYSKWTYYTENMEKSELTLA